ncbi:AtuA-related protein [Sporosarcina highlanderae]|uniref:AtuA-like ferredoxin-fold domain-containing protein n=1 Tax=Sporosarcina highlanderae TaxID=3035916 RepID=A0ABT8JT55_9BACL|nr:hypothetical protein [Sporosarcina highlanderae]MDN4608077.1 hypothetical protein [Sporosarcina highlanderae]
MARKLYELAHSRAGDKGDVLMLSLIPYEEEMYEKLREQVTADRVKSHLNHIVKGDVIRYEMPNISALQFVCQGALLGGVTTSLGMDTHGKTLSYALLEMEVDL